jgi:hypothetical protein
MRLVHVFMAMDSDSQPACVFFVLNVGVDLSRLRIELSYGVCLAKSEGISRNGSRAIHWPLIRDSDDRNFPIAIHINS